MGSHLNLEHKTFPGGKLPPCVSARSAVQGIRSDHRRYRCCSTDSNNENSTELPVGLNLVTLSHPNLCPHQYVEFYRDYVFKWMHLSGVMRRPMFGQRCQSELWELRAPGGTS